MSDTLKQKIEQAADTPLKYEIDGERIEARPVSELIEADKHLAKKRAARNPFACLKGVRLSTQGPGK